MTSNVTNIRHRIPAIPGTKPSVRNAQLLVSTGIPSLDHLIGGGLPSGSIFVIEEDKYDLYANIMLKYFVAEGVVTSQPILLASQDMKPSQLISELPAVINDSEPQKVEATSSSELEMKIAWRYQNMKLVDSSPTGSQVFSHYYDLTKPMPQELLEKAEIKQWKENNLKGQSDLFENSAYMDLLNTIQETLVDGQYYVTDTPEKRKLLRIVIHSLGSRLWLNDSEDSSHRDLMKFFYCLRALLRNSYAVGIITTPINNYENTDIVVQRIEHMSDVAIKLESFMGSSKQTNPLFKDYHGLLDLKKMPAVNTLAPHAPESRDLVFKLRRKKFIIEVLHLPPEFADTAQREQDEVVTSAVGCMSGSHKSIIDF